jgi:hypothetical protein
LQAQEDSKDRKVTRDTQVLQVLPDLGVCVVNRDFKVFLVREVKWVVREWQAQSDREACRVCKVLED